MRTTNDNLKAARDKVSDELGSIQTDLKELRDDVAALCQSIVEAGKSGLDDARFRVSRKTRENLEELLDRLKSARDRGRKTVSSLESTIEEKPLTSLIVAFVVGLFAGKLVSRV